MKMSKLKKHFLPRLELKKFWSGIRTGKHSKWTKNILRN